jgi:hypothetical protein
MSETCGGVERPGRFTEPILTSQNPCPPEGDVGPIRLQSLEHVEGRQRGWPVVTSDGRIDLRGERDRTDKPRGSSHEEQRDPERDGSPPAERSDRGPGRSRSLDAG